MIRRLGTALLVSLLVLAGVGDAVGDDADGGSHCAIGSSAEAPQFVSLPADRPAAGALKGPRPFRQPARFSAVVRVPAFRRPAIVEEAPPPARPPAAHSRRSLPRARSADSEDVH